jgi:hypothetical protein
MILHDLEVAIMEELYVLADAIYDNGKKLLEKRALDKPLLNFTEHAKFFPWLPWPDRSIIVVEGFATPERLRFAPSPSKYLSAKFREEWVFGEGVLPRLHRLTKRMRWESLVRCTLAASLPIAFLR